MKIVRGAYMGEERKLAVQLGYPSPVWDTIHDTHNAYNQTTKLLLNSINPDLGMNYKYQFLSFIIVIYEYK